MISREEGRERFGEGHVMGFWGTGNAPFLPFLFLAVL